MRVLLYREEQVIDVPPRPPAEGEVAWIHLRQPNDDEVQRILGDLFGCHPLVIEDVLHFGQRPKLDQYAHLQRPQVFITFYALEEPLEAREFCMVLGQDFLITVDRTPIAELDEVKRRVRENPAAMASVGRLLHQILDLCVDHYVQRIDRLEERMDALERHVFDHPNARVAGTIFRLKRQVGRVRRIISDGRNVIGACAHEAFPYTDERDTVYFLDVYDHATRAVDTLDAIRDGLSGLLDLQTAQRSNRMNEVMKTLTVFSTLFLPLNFIVGLYGMNFQDMPELHWRYGYLYVWCLLIAVGGAMMVYFKRRGWW
ncbi:magnesium/cobalt transporter CorA [Alicyclobacillus sp.]|uniref:magnesium/cobalt transporter CorA n=1 Tax=Alicyclobacillus sp. TaxID=61169 RepID=UPI0025B8FB70|nr:magnesium/cobalt transporter CorA [Alicyclobacillus sp.]MCL6516094.1 magnesium/cobalt transporter CorA [Alicyclobacillus sp.]